MSEMDEWFDQMLRRDLERALNPAAPIDEEDIRRWTCFSCGRPCTQAHHGDYFHDDDRCFNLIPVPTSLLELGDLGLSQDAEKKAFRAETEARAKQRGLLEERK